MAEGYKDWSPGNTLTAADLEDYTVKQSMMRFASAAARNAALAAVLTEGMCAYLLDLNVWTVYTGGAWSTVGPVHGALTSWTPTVSQGASPTITVNYAKYQRIGRLVIGWFQVTVASGSGTAANAVTVGGLPAVAAASQGFPVGSVQLYDASSTNAIVALPHLTGAVAFDLRVAAGQSDNRLGVTGTSFSAALVSPDIISGCFSYEASSDA